MTKSNSPLIPRAKPAAGHVPPSPPAAGTLSCRSVEEWIGSSPDAKIPPRVRARVFEAHHGVCHLSKRRIRAGESWECDHIIALCNGGEHRETNLAPALSEPHKIKTKADVREKAKVARLRKRHLGIKKDRTITRWLNMRGELVIASKTR